MYTTKSDLARVFTLFVPGFKQSFTYSVQRIIIHIQNQNSLRLRTDLRCRGFGLYHGLVNHIDTKAICHCQKLTCKGLCGSANQSLLTGDTVSHVGIFYPAL
jgi:hypothetical protein